MKGKGKSDTAVPRTQKDLPMKIIAIGSLLTLIAILLFFYFGVMEGNLLFTLTGVILVAVIAFLFTTVAANAIAIVGSNPVSGMTLMTLILASVIMVGRRPERPGRHGGCTDYGRRGLHCALYGRKLYHRLENRLLVG